MQSREAPLQRCSGAYHFWLLPARRQRRHAMPLARQSVAGTSSTLSLPSSLGRGTCSGLCSGPTGGESGCGSGGALAMSGSLLGLIQQRRLSKIVPRVSVGLPEKRFTRLPRPSGAINDPAELASRSGPIILASRVVRQGHNLYEPPWWHVRAK